MEERYAQEYKGFVLKKLLPPNNLSIFHVACIFSRPEGVLIFHVGEASGMLFWSRSFLNLCVWARNGLQCLRIKNPYALALFTNKFISFPFGEEAADGL